MSKRFLRVDPTVCSGHGICAELFPEMVKLDDWGYPIIAPVAVPASLIGMARRAVAECPALALALSDHPGGRAAALDRQLASRRQNAASFQSRVNQ